MAIKGLNKIAFKGVDKSGGKRTRILTDETRARKLAGVLEQLEAGKVCVDSELQKYKTFDRYPDTFVERCFQALKYGGTPGEIREAGRKTFELYETKGIMRNLREAKAQIYAEAKVPGPKGKGLTDMNAVSQVFELEGPFVKVVNSDLADLEGSEEDSEAAAQ